MTRFACCAWRLLRSVFLVKPGTRFQYPSLLPWHCCLRWSTSRILAHCCVSVDLPKSSIHPSWSDYRSLFVTDPSQLFYYPGSCFSLGFQRNALQPFRFHLRFESADWFLVEIRVDLPIRKQSWCHLPGCCQFKSHKPLSRLGLAKS